MNFPIKHFVSYYRPYLKQLCFVLTYAFMSTALALIFPLLVRHVTGDVLSGDLTNAQDQVIQFGLMMIGLAVLQQIFTFLLDFKGHMLGARMERDLRNDLFEHIQRLSFSYFDKVKTGELMSRIGNDLYSISEVYHHGIEDLILFGLRFIGAVTVLLVINARLTLVIVAFLPFMAVFTYFCNKQMNKTFMDNKKEMAEIHTQVEDSLSGVREVQSFTNETLEIDKFRRQNERFLNSRKETYKVETALYNGVEGFIRFITIAVVLYGATLIIGETLNLADLLAFMLYIDFLVAPIRRMLVFSAMMQDAFTGFQRFSELMHTQSDIKSPNKPADLTSLEGSISFRQVGFTYPHSDQPVFEKLTLKINPGEYVALVGASGAGKSTISKLIPRFYDVTHGSVTLDGHDVRHLSLPFVREQIGIVQQDVYLFSGSIKDNIRYGKPDATEEEVIEAARKANAHDFILALPNGYDSEVGQRGVRLSGGQKQRISIARVFLKNPPILILDEATSSLDNESEYIVKASMETLAKGRTTLVIAHRLSTIKNAERIIVLENGSIVEEGTHDVLIKNTGPYYNLYNQQFKL
ncbi:ABC transporter ATP-binding protein [Alkalibacterium pelagium]|uniref:Multidrug resistance ABC transporter ATP-binding and permease protein n=1 Tax=Alkalibacterium pelagium TaxID=426702 RepID=A0A1H7M2Q3_9LACT|nr:ABC transporter ATP-binding protein [Alkalibacterium pelagium]GEN51026.1 ABC transporter ATP-binding protein [Alkalibacterium pelagium]SEL05005.1 ATP-binding cassette, subfamily B [Alkalibacterium pelagium]